MMDIHIRHNPDHHNHRMDIVVIDIGYTGNMDSWLGIDLSFDMDLDIDIDRVDSNRIAVLGNIGMRADNSHSSWNLID